MSHLYSADLFDLILGIRFSIRIFSFSYSYQSAKDRPILEIFVTYFKMLDKMNFGDKPRYARLQLFEGKLGEIIDAYIASNKKSCSCLPLRSK